MKNIQRLIPFDFILIMIMAIILALLNIIIILRTLFQFNLIVHYWIDLNSKTMEISGAHVTIDSILITIIFKIENVIQLIQIQMIYVLILNKLRMQSNLKMKINENNCKLSCDSKCNTMDQLQLTQVTLHMSYCCKVQLIGMLNIYLFVYLILCLLIT